MLCAHPIGTSYAKYWTVMFRYLMGCASDVVRWVHSYLKVSNRYKSYVIPGETGITRGKGEAFHPGIGYASYLNIIPIRLFTHHPYSTPLFCFV